MSAPSFNRWLFLLLPLPALVYGLYYAVLLAVQEPAFTLAVDRPDARSGAEIQRQFFWVSVFAISVAVSVVVGISAGLMAWGNFAPRDRWMGAVFFAIGMGFAVVGEMFATGPRFYAHMGAGLFDAAFCQGGDCTQLRQLDFGLDVTKFCGAFAVTLLSLAIVSTLHNRPGEDRAASHARALKQQDALLYRAAVFYVLACLSMVVWMFWPLPYLAEDQAQAYRAVMTGQAVLVGVGYSLGTASVFVPAAMVLAARKEHGAGGAGQTPDAAPEFAPTNPVDALRRLGAIMLPTVVAFLPFLEPLFW